MKILITGSNGQLGREWSEFLQQKQAGFSAYSSTQLDITNTTVVEEKLSAERPDVLINCAAYTKVDQAEVESEKAMLINAEAVKNLAETCARFGIKLVHYSTDYIFEGSAADRETYPAGYPENHRPAPQNVYGHSKLKGEEAIRDSGCEHLIIRVSWLCGKYGHNFVKTMLRLSQERDELSIVDDQYGSPTFAANVVENTYRLLELGEKGEFHVSSAGMATWFDFAREIFRQANVSAATKPVSSSEFAAKAKRPAFSLLNTSKIASLPGINIQNWKTGLNHLLKQINED